MFRLNSLIKVNESISKGKFCQGEIRERVMFWVERAGFWVERAELFGGRAINCRPL